MILGIEPKMPFRESLRHTIEWYFASKDREQVREIVGQGALIERKVESSAT